ncbi:MAG TPA: amidohydrolase family protein [Bryobacteraceae bacterium]|nr:amidohydrolase family protein [Bryobacteraceae bacterium]
MRTGAASLPILAITLTLVSLCAAGPDTILLRGATVHPVSGPDIADGSVLLRDGKIAEIGARIAVPKGARVVELKGLHIYPGMIDSATEIGLSEIGAVREMNDVSDIGLFKPQLRAASAVNPASEHIPVTRANGITSVITSPGGGIVAGQSVLMHLSGWTMEDMAVRAPAAMRLEFPNIRTPNRFAAAETPGRTSAYAEAKKRYEQQMRDLNDFMESARRYRQAKAVAGPDFEIDLKLEAMIPVLDGKLPMLIRAEKEKTIKEAIAFADKQKVHMILERGTEAWKVAAELKAHNIPVVLPPTLRLPDEEDDPYDKPFSIPGELSKAGVKFAFASFGPGDEDNPRNLPYEAAAAVGFGLPREEALKAVTIYAAQIWGVGDEIGSIEKGKWADLIVTDGDPLETRTQIKQMYIKGAAVDLDNKHHRLYEKYLAR